MVETMTNLKDKCKEQAAETIQKLYNLFIKSDCNLLEINPMAEDVEGDGSFLFPGNISNTA